MAARLTGRMRIEVEEIPTPDIPSLGMLVHVRSCGICGSDINRIRTTTSDSPRVLGHEIAGDVVAVSGPEGKFKPGERVVVGHVHVPCMHCVYCRHESYSMCRQFKRSAVVPGGYAEFVAIPHEQMQCTVLGIPDDLAYDEATFVDPVACCLRALRRCRVRSLDRVLVVGAGLMGLLFAQLLRLMQAETFLFDVSTARLGRARACGASHIFNPQDPLAVQEVLSRTDGVGVDVAIATFSNKSTIEQATSCMRDGGTLCVFAPPLADEGVDLNAGAVFYRELSLIGSYSSAPSDLEAALEWIHSRKVDVKSLITTHTDLAGIASAVSALTEQSYKIIVHP